MADLNPGVIVQLPELKLGSQLYKPLQSVRVLGLVENFTVETGMAEISHGGARLRVDLQHIRDVYFRKGSLYQFIGELIPDPIGISSEQLMLQVRVARNVDGLDLNLYENALQLRRQFERKYLPDGTETSS